MKDMKYVQMTMDIMDSNISPESSGGVVSTKTYHCRRKLKNLKGPYG